ncbi:ser thr protein kinase-lyk4 [Nesidiocoris tenuis]|uniref:Serine/threonine-protein kinase 40 n=1 Tax=Nesidiocoris tenuis TaxID=355587 RepID=A0ABN7B974_9HEMI|nr:ser thr protein kinase-lyk4 [Nesidiocoris tenuis]
MMPFDEDYDVDNFEIERKRIKLSRKRSAADPCPSEPQPGPSIERPAEGTPVCMKKVKRAGPYLLGPAGNSPVKSIVQCLARLQGTNNFYSLKILTLKDAEEETKDDHQGKMLLHTEYSLLSLLHDMDNVIHHHGLFKDKAFEEKTGPDRKLYYTGRVVRRLCLVLDCLVAHDFSPQTADLINLQHYVIREKKLSEREAALILFNTVKVVDELHKRNIVHRDLKLGNLVLHQSTHRITITNFCLGKLLVTENDLLKDQRGSPAYISPDVLCGKPYVGKPSDMWALGVILFTMLYGQFPFYDSSPSQLFNRIKAADYTMPNDGRVSEGMIHLIKNLLLLNPTARWKTGQTLDALTSIFFATSNIVTSSEPLQVVPDVDEEDDKTGQIVDETKSDDVSNYFTESSTIRVANLNPEVRPEPVQETRLPGQISVHRVGEDAREITEAELNRVRNLLPLNIRVDCGPQNSSRPVRFTVISARRNLAHNLSRSRFQAPEAGGSRIAR